MAKTLPCPDCGTELPFEVVEALSILYGGTSLRIDDLARQLALQLRIAERIETWFSDEALGEAAIASWFDEIGPHTLIQAARHHERLASNDSECGRAQTARIAREDAEAARG